MYYFCQKHYPVNYEIRAFGQMALMTIIMVATFIIIELTIHSFALSLFLKFILLCLFPIGIYFGGVFDIKEKNAINLIIKQKSLNSILSQIALTRE
jgi:hypothetical protein